MDATTIDQEFERLQGEFADVAGTVKSLAAKMQTASSAGDANATEWLNDLRQVAKDIDDEEAQTQSLLLAIHGFISGLNDEKPAEQASAGEPEQQQQQAAAAQQQAQPSQRRGLMGGGLMGGYGSSGFARAMEMGMGMSIGRGLMQGLLR